MDSYGYCKNCGRSFLAQAICQETTTKHYPIMDQLDDGSVVIDQPVNHVIKQFTVKCTGCLTNYQCNARETEDGRILTDFREVK